MSVPPVVALITARGGSQGIPRKNVRLLGDIPLIAWSIRAALASQYVRRVVVSTDDDEIAAVAREHGADVPFKRPAHLATGTAAHVDVYEHFVEWLRAQPELPPDYVLMLQPTSPFRTPADIDAAIRLAGEWHPPAVVGVSEATDHPLLVHKIDAEGALEPYIQSDLAYLRRQDLPPAYRVNGALYLNRPDEVLKHQTFTPPGTLPYVMPLERALDIDTPADLAAAQRRIASQEITNDNK